VRCDIGRGAAGRRTAGVCWATAYSESTAVNLNAEMVRLGLALPEGEDGALYMIDEEAARETGQGLWSGQFLNPAEWRRLYAHADSAAEPGVDGIASGNP
jgi:endonuclease YncB( thermonuclease family)